jgi:hypothetical protein
MKLEFTMEPDRRRVPFNPFEIGRIGEEFFKRFGALHGCRVIDEYQEKPGVTRAMAKMMQQTKGDFRISRGRYEINVDAKHECAYPRSNWPSGNFPVEIKQCVDRGDPGWIDQLTECDEIWYGQSSPDPECTTWRELSRSGCGVMWWTIHRINVKRLRDHIHSGHAHGWHELTTTRNYGKTLLKLAPIGDLVTFGIAKWWWGDRY